MALKKTATTPQGFNAVDAYHRIENVTLISKNAISYVVRSYKQPSGFPSFNEMEVSSEYDISKENPIKQAYLHLKTLPEFSNAQDC